MTPLPWWIASPDLWLGIALGALLGALVAWPWARLTRLEERLARTRIDVMHLIVRLQKGRVGRDPETGGPLDFSQDFPDYLDRYYQHHR